jgi:uncharacterized repeat protein (TIGR01451 family)
VTNFAEITASDQADPDSSVSSDRNSDDRGDGLPDDDEASITLTPQAADLSLSLVVDNRAPDVGANATYTMILTNAGPNDDTGVVVTQVLPTGVNWVSGGAYDSGSRTVTWTVGNINNGQTLTQNVEVRSGRLAAQHRPGEKCRPARPGFRSQFRFRCRRLGRWL